jgi:hypothetical protein
MMMMMMMVMMMMMMMMMYDDDGHDDHHHPPHLRNLVALAKADGQARGRGVMEGSEVLGIPSRARDTMAAGVGEALHKQGEDRHHYRRRRRHHHGGRLW